MDSHILLVACRVPKDANASNLYLAYNFRQNYFFNVYFLGKNCLAILAERTSLFTQACVNFDHFNR